jgi:hypothetical protein
VLCCAVFYFYVKSCSSGTFPIPPTPPSLPSFVYSTYFSTASNPLEPFSSFARPDGGPSLHCTALHCTHPSRCARGMCSLECHQAPRRDLCWRGMQRGWDGHGDGDGNISVRRGLDGIELSLRMCLDADMGYAADSTRLWNDGRGWHVLLECVKVIPRVGCGEHAGHSSGRAIERCSACNACSIVLYGIRQDTGN